MTTEAQRRAISKYHKKMRAFTVRFECGGAEWLWDGIDDSIERVSSDEGEGE